ncbi:MAG: hypothetical protein BGO98_01620 [Myxococcales bacterium 68-20]|nr:MAG: hypothetical protein BGO98_01620 [Myxococcales bacterium 68-20]
MKPLRLATLLALLVVSCRPETDSPPSPPIEQVRSPLGPAYPLQRGPAGGRHLIDAQGAPFFWAGDAAWSLIAQVSLADAEQYLEDRKSKGFNVVMVSLIESTFSTNPPANFYGVRPFTGRPFATPNPAYFAHADAVIQAAAARGIMVLLAPVYLGAGCGSEGWCTTVQAATNAEMRSWGQYVGARYASFDNIVWMIGGDMDPSPVRTKTREVALGIRDHDPRHLMTAHSEAESFPVTSWPGESWLGINSIYSYEDAMYRHYETAYQYTPTMPFFMLESKYENERGVSTQELRSQAYWAVLSGGMGYVFGNCPIWHFGSVNWCGTTNWKASLSSAGSTSMQHVNRLFTSRPWHTLVPDFSHTTLTAGYGTYGTMTYATAARASDGATVIAYLPTARQVTVDMSRVSGAQAKAWWYEPSAGLATAIGTYATSGARSFTPPASGDWVLVVDDASKPFNPPGSPDGSTPPDTVVDFESLANDAALGTFGGITWGTANGGWKVWDGGSVYSKNAYVNTTSTGEVTTTFTLPAGRVLKSINIASGSGGSAIVKISSPGNPERVYTDIDGGYKTKSLGWTAASSVVTVKITAAGTWGASDLAFDNLVYGELAGSPGNQPPTIATAAAAIPSSVTTTTTALTALGADDGGEGSLTYAWSAVTTPSGGGVTFSANGSNAAKSVTATFTRSGTYGLRVTVTDSGGLTATSNVSVEVQATPTSIAVSPATLTLAPAATAQLTATARDQFSVALASQPAFAWSVNGGGTISSSGLFTAGASSGGPFTATASSGGRSGTSQITITSASTSDVTITFESLVNDAVLGTFGGVTWGTTSGGWRIWDGPSYTKNAYVDSTSTSEVTATFTLPAGTVLKSLKIASGSGGSGTVKLSSAGNTERIYSDIHGTYQTKVLGWTNAASVVTVKITATGVWGASDLAFDDVVYGAP